MISFRAIAVLLSLVVLAIAPARARCQDGEGVEDEKAAAASGQITGRVIGDGGKPLARASVTVAAGGRALRSVPTDEDGRFHIADVGPGAYQLFAFAPGYVADGEANWVPARPGDDVTIRRTRGGVVAGRVTDVDGAPLVTIPVRLKLIRDGRGRRLRLPDTRHETTTDDRGEYRIYGLPAGTYLVMAGGRSDEVYRPSIFTLDAPTYHPSATADTAVPIEVRAGQEITGVDIRYRALRGHRVSGRIDPPPPGVKGVAGVNLMSAADGTMLASERATPGAAGAWTFQFDGVPDGVYLLWGYFIADERTATAGSASMRVVVRGSDATGLALSVVPYGAVTGSIVVERGELPEACAKAPVREPADIDQKLARDTAGESDALRAQSFYSISVEEKGDFVLRGVRPGAYRFLPILPAGLYLKSLSQDGPAPKAGGTVRASSLEKLSITPGKTIAGVRIVYAHGAASAEGRVTMDEGAPSQRVYVHLVPAEAGQESAVVRYYEVEARADGSFAFEGLAPGRYWLAVELASLDESDRETRRAAWDATVRSRVRAEAQQLEREVILGPCQRATGLSVALPAAPARE
jgi:hypothetical protein